MDEVELAATDEMDEAEAAEEADETALETGAPRPTVILDRARTTLKKDNMTRIVG